MTCDCHCFESEEEDSSSAMQEVTVPVEEGNTAGKLGSREKIGEAEDRFVELKILSKRQLSYDSTVLTRLVCSSLWRS